MMGRLEAAIEELDAIDPTTLTDGELHDAVVGMQRAASLFASVRARFLSVWEAQRTWADDGSKAAGARLARECGTAKATAARELWRARRLRSMPHTAAALRDGTLSLDYVDLLAHVNQRNVAALFARDEQLLVQQLTTLDYRSAVRVVKFWQQQAHDELGIDTTTRQYQGRRAHCSRSFEDTVVLDAEFDKLGGAIFLEELERLEQQLFEDDWKQARDEHGPDALPDQLPRTAAQRRLDAMVEMARRSAAMPPDARPTRPLFTVIIGYRAFANLCELAGGTMVSPGQLIPHLGEADIERIVFDSPSRVIDVGVRDRFFTGGLRRAIEVRDRHCQHPSGCDIVAERCHIDHIQPYSDNGLTIQANGRCYCPVHNRQRVGNKPGSDPPDDG